MKEKIAIGLIATLGAGMTGFVIVVAIMIGSPLLGLIAAVAAGGAALIVVRPFWGLLAIVTFAQLDTFANILSEDLPISIVKLLTVVTLGGVVVNSFREPRADRIGPREPALRYAVIFGLALFLTGLYAEDGKWVAWSIEKLGGMLVLFYLMIRLVREQWQVDLLVLVIVGSTLFSSAIVVYDYTLGDSLLATSNAATEAEYQGVSRSAGASDSDPTTAATMLLAGTMLALFLALRTPSWRWLNLTTAGAGTVAIMFSFARSSAVAYAIAIAWLIWKYRKHRHFPVLIAGILLIGVMAAPFVPDDYYDRLESIGDIESDRSVQRRIAYNLIGLELLLESPVLGVGPGNFRVHYGDEEYRRMPGRTLHERKLHNMFLSVPVETGLFGAIGFFGILLAALVGMEDARNRAESTHLRLVAEAVQFCFVAYLIASAFTPNEYNKYTWVLAGIGIAITRIANVDRPSMPLLFGKREA